MSSVNTLFPRFEPDVFLLQLTLIYLHSNKRVLTALQSLRQSQSLVYYNATSYSQILALENNEVPEVQIQYRYVNLD